MAFQYRPLFSVAALTIRVELLSIRPRRSSAAAAYQPACRAQGGAIRL